MVYLTHVSEQSSIYCCEKYLDSNHYFSLCLNWTAVAVAVAVVAVDDDVDVDVVVTVAAAAVTTSCKGYYFVYVTTIQELKFKDLMIQLCTSIFNPFFK